MKKWYIGVDGGGTKTAIAISTEDRHPKAMIRKTGCSYQSLGIPNAVKIIEDGVGECLDAAGLTREDCAGCCIGVPCFGESPENDRAIVNSLQRALSPMPIHVVNDVEVGWAGALAYQEGIHIVAGTGAIAFGKGIDGKTARSGGWNEFFGDEGSCYWIGKEAMSLFSKESDGRVPRGALYDTVKKEFGFKDDFDFVSIIVNDIAPHRDKVAAFQLYASLAAQSGDPAAIEIYKRAARELAMLAGALRNKLTLPEGNAKVSYSGGLFQVNELILTPLGDALSTYQCTLQAPKYTAVEGALMLAIDQFKGGN